MNFFHCVFLFNLLVFDFDCVLLLWLVGQQCLACSRTATALGRRLPYCGPMTFLPFRALSPQPPVRLAGAKKAAVYSTFLAHNSMSVINTSTDSATEHWQQHSILASGMAAGQPWPIFNTASFCCCYRLSLSKLIEHRAINVISEVIIEEVVSQSWPWCYCIPAFRQTNVSLKNRTYFI